MKLTLAFMLVVAILATDSMAQQVTGDLEGRALDEQGIPIVHAKILVTNTDLQFTRGAVSGTDGFFRILALQVGNYSVNITHSNYQQVTYDRVLINLGKTTRLPESPLAVRVREAPEVVIVVGRRSVIEPVSATLGDDLTKDEFEDLPLERDYKNIPLLLPHVNQSFYGDEINYAGATGLENKYFIDGVEVTDPVIGGTGTNLPYNFIQELEIKTGGYEAEYRSSLGALLNVVTLSGSNEFHGQLFGFFTGNRLSASTRQATFEPRQGDFSQYDVGFSLSGPIVRNKLWFSVAYNPQFEREDVEIPGIGFFEDQMTRHTFAGKISWQADPKTNVALTVIGDPMVRDAVGEMLTSTGAPILEFKNPDPWLTKITAGGTNVILKGTRVLSDNAFLDLSASVITLRDKLEPATDRQDTLFIDDTAGDVLSGGTIGTSDDFSLQAVVDVSGAVILGPHTLKGGIAYKDNKYDVDGSWAMLIYPISPFEGFPTPSYTLFAATYEEATVRNRVPSFFVQDSWRVNERLRLNVGLRWDGQYVIGSNGDVAQKITDQYQPRLGFAFQPGELGSQRIFGSFGRFYQEVTPFLARSYFNDKSTREYSVYECDPRSSSCEPLWELFEGAVYDEVDGLEGQHYDEFTLGYERQFGTSLRFGVRGIYRSLGQVIDDLFDRDSGEFALGNPGKGRFSDWPKAKRDYTALELTAKKLPSRGSSFIASYVLSRNHGNYTGLFATDLGLAIPNQATWDHLENLDNAEGLLPNDRTHVFKFSGSYRWDLGFSAGTSFSWQSGTPLSEFGPAPPGSFLPGFISERGSAGRTQWLWDLNLRFAYDVPWRTGVAWNQRLLLDILHLASQREPVVLDEQKLISGGDSSILNPNHGRALGYQPAMTIRLGTEVSF